MKRSRKITFSTRYLSSAILALAIVPPIFCQSQNEAQVFAPGVISTGHEAGITFTPDGKTLYFARRVDRKQPAHIYRSHSVEGVWQAPQEVLLGGDTWFDLDPCISPDGNRLFFVSSRSRDGVTANKVTMHLWVADRNGVEWGTPKWVDNVNSESKDGTPTVTRDGTLYLFSDRKDGPNKDSIYESKLVSGKYTTPVLLPPPINSGTSDTSPFISPNGKVLLFYSTRSGGLGDADIYVSFRKHGKWSEPFNLGPVVNSSVEEDNPVVSPDGKQLFFGRNGTLYVVPVAAVPALKKANFR